MKPSDEFMAEFNRLKYDGGAARLLKELFPQLELEHQRTFDERAKLIRQKQAAVGVIKALVKSGKWTLKFLGEDE